MHNIDFGNLKHIVRNFLREKMIHFLEIFNRDTYWTQKVNIFLLYEVTFQFPTPLQFPYIFSNLPT